MCLPQAGLTYNASAMAFAHWTTAAPYPFGGTHIDPLPGVADAPGDGEEIVLVFFAAGGGDKHGSPLPLPPIHATAAETVDKSRKAIRTIAPAPPMTSTRGLFDM